MSPQPRGPGTELHRLCGAGCCYVSYFRSRLGRGLHGLLPLPPSPAIMNCTEYRYRIQDCLFFSDFLCIKAMGIFKEKGMGSHDWLWIVTCRQQLPVSAHRQRELSRPEAEGRGGSRGRPDARLHSPDGTCSKYKRIQ